MKWIRIGHQSTVLWSLKPQDTADLKRTSAAHEEKCHYICRSTTKELRIRTPESQTQSTRGSQLHNQAGTRRDVQNIKTPVGIHSEHVGYSEHSRFVVLKVAPATLLPKWLRGWKGKKNEAGGKSANAKDRRNNDCDLKFLSKFPKVTLTLNGYKKPSLWVKICW